MIQHGYRLYEGLDGLLRLDQIFDGMIYPLVPSDEDKKMRLGYYDFEMNLIEPEEIEK